MPFFRKALLPCACLVLALAVPHQASAQYKAPIHRYCTVGTEGTLCRYDTLEQCNASSGNRNRNNCYENAEWQQAHGW